MSRSKALVTLGVMLSLFMASMEATVVATAMPSIVSQLGGLATYSWVFSAFLLASTTTVPIFGKLSDLFGRRLIFAVAMGLFLIGSVLSGRAESMSQLVAFRVVQGLGAGGVLPLAFIIVGAMFNYEQRARIQGLFSSVWGLSSVVGPLLGGFLVDQVSWRWVFYINVFPGLLAALLIWFMWVDDARPEDTNAVPVDYLGAVLLTAGVIALLLGLFELRMVTGWLLLVLALGFFAALVWVEQNATDPVLPLSLLRDRLFAAACGHGLLAGVALFGSIAFVPLFVQAVLGTSATAAGATITPLVLGWFTASIVGSRLLLRIGYRTLVLIGMSILSVGTFLMSWIGAGTGRLTLVGNLTLMGVGMGMSIPAFLIAVQTSVPRRVLGTATSTLQFSQSIGGAVGVGVMGAVLSLKLSAVLSAAGVDPAVISVNRLLDPLARTSATMVDVTVRNALAGAIQTVFFIAFIAVALGLAVSAFAPPGRIAQLAARREAEHEVQPASVPVTGPD